MSTSGEYLGYKWVMHSENTRRVDIYCPTPIVLSTDDAVVGIYADNYRSPVQEVRCYVYPREDGEAYAQGVINKLVVMELKENVT